MASHLHLPVGELQRRIGSREFTDWQIYLDDLQNEPTVDQYYFAQLSQDIRRLFSKHPDKIKLEECLLKFTKVVHGKGAPDEPKLTPEERLKLSKGYWGMLADIAKDKGKTKVKSKHKPKSQSRKTPPRPDSRKKP